MASGQDGDRMGEDLLIELDNMARNLLNGSEQDLQAWADGQDVGRLRTLPQQLLDASAEHERRAGAVSTLAYRLRDVLAAASRGHALHEEPQAADAPMPAMGVSTAPQPERAWR